MQINPLRTFLIIWERYALIPYKIKHESRRNIQLGNELKTQIKYLWKNKIFTYNERYQKLVQTFSHTSWFKKTGLLKNFLEVNGIWAVGYSLIFSYKFPWVLSHKFQPRRSTFEKTPLFIMLTTFNQRGTEISIPIQILSPSLGPFISRKLKWFLDFIPYQEFIQNNFSCKGFISLPIENVGTNLVKGWVV